MDREYTPNQFGIWKIWHSLYGYEVIEEYIKGRYDDIVEYNNILDRKGRHIDLVDYKKIGHGQGKVIADELNKIKLLEEELFDLKQKHKLE